MSKKKRDFVPIQNVIKEVMKGLKKSAGASVAEMTAIWDDLVGEDLARLTRVRAVTPRSVEIEADGSAVLAEVRQYYREAFLEKLKEAGKDGVDRVSFFLADA